MHVSTNLFLVEFKKVFCNPNNSMCSNPSTWYIKRYTKWFGTSCFEIANNVFSTWFLVGFLLCNALLDQQVKMEVTVCQTVPAGVTSYWPRAPTLITLFSGSHVPSGWAGIPCTRARDRRDKGAESPSPALCLTHAQYSRTRPLISNKCCKSPMADPLLVKTVALLPDDCKPLHSGALID